MIDQSTQQDQNNRIPSQKPVHPLVSNQIPFLPSASRLQACQSRHTHILLINLSLLTGLPFLPPDTLGVSVHISFTFSNTILQCRSKAFTLANNFRLLRHEISTCVCERTAVCRMERGPEVNSCSSSNAISYSLDQSQYSKSL